MVRDGNRIAGSSTSKGIKILSKREAEGATDKLAFSGHALSSGLLLEDAAHSWGGSLPASSPGEAPYAGDSNLWQVNIKPNSNREHGDPDHMSQRKQMKWKAQRGASLSNRQLTSIWRQGLALRTVYCRLLG